MFDQQQVPLFTQIAKALSESAELDTTTGQIHFGNSLLIPAEPPACDPADLNKLKLAFLAGTLNPEMFDFVQFLVRAQVPDKESGTKPGTFPDQLAIVERAGRYAGLHQLDLVLRNPAVTVVEVQNGIRANMK
jgi:hypothetical protein